jgi:hypothetical protein
VVNREYAQLNAGALKGILAMQALKYMHLLCIFGCCSQCPSRSEYDNKDFTNGINLEFCFMPFDVLITDERGSVKNWTKDNLAINSLE